MSLNRASDILRRVIDPDRGCWAREAAQAMLGLDFPASDRARMQALSEKANAGTLTPEERDELEGYVNVGHFLAFVHSKARRSLRPQDRTTAA